MKKLALAVLSLLASTAAAPAFHVIDRVSGADGGWDYLTVDTANHRLLVARSTEVMALDLQSGKVTPALATGVRLHAAIPVNGGKELLLTNGGSDTATFVDAKTGALLATVKTGKRPDAAVADMHSRLVLVMNHGGGDITLIDPKTHATVGTIAVGGALEAAAIDGRGMAYVNVEDKNEIAAIDIAKRQVTKRFALATCDGPTGIVYDAADKLLLAACDGATAVVQPSTGKTLQSLPTGAGADGIAFDSRRGLAFVPAGEDGVLSIVQLRAGKAAIVDRVATQKGARTIALDQATGRIYLPAARYAAAASPGARPAMISGSFQVLIVGN